MMRELRLSLYEKWRQFYVICAKQNLSFLLHFIAVSFAARLHITSKKLSYHTFNGIGLYVPFYNGSYQVIREVFIEDIYKPLLGCKTILDIGAYIGDSALYFAHSGAQVVAYEMNADLYAIALLNTYKNPHITLHNGAVVVDNSTPIHIQRRHIYDNAGAAQHGTVGTNIPSYNILDILTQHTFDGLKMDIEGAEYPILETLMYNDIFPFERGMIELHDIGKEKNAKLIDTCTQYLQNHGYVVDFFRNNDARYTSEHPSMIGVTNLHFYKKNLRNKK